ncbi:poly(ADP-ribose) glycohydrolase [Aplysia californica]|uniref:poly(ADP-ribose) glycohydrolase n=1 Tax=Aplysia californica TaxID=6500 RepID=A0ABM0ZX90_APLCA|nr:poly(ADP-ribose) glycohydrolase [Aplysia californica]
MSQGEKKYIQTTLSESFTRTDEKKRKHCEEDVDQLGTESSSMERSRDSNGGAKALKPGPSANDERKGFPGSRGGASRDKPLNSNIEESDNGRTKSSTHSSSSSAFDDKRRDLDDYHGDSSKNYDDDHFEDEHGSKTDPDLDDDGDNAGIMTMQPTSKPAKTYWKGEPIKDLRYAPDCFKDEAPIEWRASHETKVMFEIPQSEPPTPYPREYFEQSHLDKSNFVFMPCSPASEIPCPQTPGKIVRRWKVIESSLHQDLPGSFELQDAILSYNFHYRKKWDFENFHSYFKKCSPNERTDFFNTVLPKMQRLALQLPSLCTQPLPMLKRNQNRKLVISQQQAACLLANAFFCTFPGRNFRQRGVIPDINFSSLFNGPSCSRKIEKLKCIFHYFKRITEKMPTGVLSFNRRTLDNTLWLKDSVDFTKMHVSCDGTIEDDGRGMLQADFANKYVGGGVLGRGCVQEEIRFMICPEMILSRLFTEVLEDRDILIMKGCERFSNYAGYSDSFKWNGNHVDTTERDCLGRLWTEVVAMDAVRVKRTDNQFAEHMVNRELHKAFCAFVDPEHNDNLPAVCTGNWGCGAFGGDKHLKALIQMIAASHAKREMCYFTFGDNSLCDEIAKINYVLCSEGLSTVDVLNKIREFRHQELLGNKKSLFKFIVTEFGLGWKDV